MTNKISIVIEMEEFFFTQFKQNFSLRFKGHLYL
jgi:hypothetical protein